MGGGGEGGGRGRGGPTGIVSVVLDIIWNVSRPLVKQLRQSVCYEDLTRRHHIPRLKYGVGKYSIVIGWQVRFNNRTAMT